MRQFREAARDFLQSLCCRISGDTAPRIDFPPSIRVQSPHETLRVCRELIAAKQRGAYLRFGDGDVNLLHGEGELLQQASPRLQQEMREAFELYGAGIMKCLPLHSPRFGLWPGMAPGIHGADDTWTERLLSRCYLYFIGTPIYTNHALSYLAVFEPTMATEFLRFLKAQNLLFVGNENVPAEVLCQLFRNTVHIKTPNRSSYAEIDRIEQETLEYLQNRNQDRFTVIVLAMGCSGRVLQKRIYNAGADVFSFDFGSLLDTLCGWNTRAWMELAPYDARKLLEEL